MVGNSNSNINNVGFVAKAGEWIVYSNFDDNNYLNQHYTIWERMAAKVHQFRRLLQERESYTQIQWIKCG